MGFLIFIIFGVGIAFMIIMTSDSDTKPTTIKHKETKNFYPFFNSYGKSPLDAFRNKLKK